MNRIDGHNFGNWFADIINNPDKINQEFKQQSNNTNEFDMLEKELNNLFSNQNLSYYIRLNEIKENYKVYRNEIGQHKIKRKA